MGSKEGQTKDKAESMAITAQARKGSVSYRVDPVLLSTPRLKPKNVTHYVNHDYSWKRQNGEIKQFFRNPKVTLLGQPKGFVVFI